MNHSFKITINQTCRKFIKRCYELSTPTDMLLVDNLGDFGVIEIQDFKKYLPTAKNVYKICMEDYVYISGALDDTLIYFTIPKENEMLISNFEDRLTKWLAKY